MFWALMIKKIPRGVQMLSNSLAYMVIPLQNHLFILKIRTLSNSMQKEIPDRIEKAWGEC